jgi:dTDP-4-amino-4,6-dideoxygalactose transaminase
MIPRHRPPFGLWGLLAALSTTLRNVSVEEIEAAYAKAFDLPQVVLLPSARAGICWALRAAVSPNTCILGPAYTCRVVHEAIVRVGCGFRFIDNAPEGFLMDSGQLALEQTGDYALVLCEIFGLAYDLQSLRAAEKNAPRLRILDVAMTVPVPATFGRLEGSDFAAVSFGLGKCLYAGWGGLGITRDEVLANEVRNQRDRLLHKESISLRLGRCAEIIMRTVAHERILYGALKKLRAEAAEDSAFPPWSGDQDLSGEWYLPSAPVDRGLTLYNLQRSFELYERRIALCRRYHDNLAHAPGITLSSCSPHAMSHYTIRVPADYRGPMRQALLRSEIDTGTLFHLPSYLSPTEFPNAGKISEEVINLPLDAHLSEADVDYISECVLHCARELSN